MSDLIIENFLKVNKNYFFELLFGAFPGIKISLLEIGTHTMAGRMAGAMGGIAATGDGAGE